MKQKPKRRKSIIVRLIVLGVSAYFIFSLIGLGDDLVEVKSELTKLQQQLNEKVLYKDELIALMDEDSYDDIIEKAARERLGWVFGDETIFKDTSGN